MLAVAVVSEQTLEQLETVIERGRRIFVEVGEALAEIQERRLYREQGYDTFEDYCRDRWGWSRYAGYQYIRAAEVARNVELTQQVAPSLTQAFQLAPLPAEQQREIAERVDFANTTVRELRAIVQDVQQKPAHVSFNSGNNEWYTPSEYAEAARQTLGQIDLDPASSAIANEAIRATTYYTAEDDGLQHHWAGRVWMNPPYASALIGKFAAKLICHFSVGDISEAIVLVNNATETNWFQGMLAHAAAVCFPMQRVRFLDVEGNPGAPLQGQAILYLGGYANRFAKHFNLFGAIVYGSTARRY